MSETKMPAAEAEVVTEDEERFSYELSFHVLPTVAEGEVSAVFDTIKAAITGSGAELFDEEAPERFDLAYDIVTHLEGKNRKFSSAYFGWARFTSEAGALASITEVLDANTQVLRHMLVKLTKAEEAHPFRFHEALQDQKKVTTVEESTVVPDFTTVKAEEPAKEVEAKAEEVKEESAEVDDKELEKALEEKEV